MVPWLFIVLKRSGRDSAIIHPPFFFSDPSTPRHLRNITVQEQDTACCKTLLTSNLLSAFPCPRDMEMSFRFPVTNTRVKIILVISKGNQSSFAKLITAFLQGLTALWEDFPSAVAARLKYRFSKSAGCLLFLERQTQVL